VYGGAKIQLKLKVTVQVYDGIIVPEATTVSELDAVFDDTVDCVELGFHEIVTVLDTSDGNV
jgi:predicted nucleic acid-binding protein